MGLANWLTVLRILLIPVFVCLLVYRKPGLAFIVFVGAALTDLLDGYVARRHGLQSRLGAFLDPTADKLLLVSSFVTLTWLKALPFWIAAVVISRDLILMVGALVIHMAGGRIYPPPARAGDRILAINGHALRDAIDFQFHAGEEHLALSVERAGVTQGLRLARRARA